MKQMNQNLNEMMYLSKLLFLTIVVLLPLSSLSSSFEAIEALNSYLDAQRSSSYVQELAAKAVLQRLLPTHLSSFEFKIVPKVLSEYLFIYYFLANNILGFCNSGSVSGMCFVVTNFTIFVPYNSWVFSFLLQVWFWE